MKYLLFFSAIFLAGLAKAQVDSALRYNISSMTYRDAVDAKMAQLYIENPQDTTEGGDLNDFRRKSEFRAPHKCPPLLPEERFW